MLSEYFSDDLRLLVVEKVKNADIDYRSKLRYLLCSRGIYVPKDGNIVISDSLYAVVKEYIQWTADDIYDDIYLKNLDEHKEDENDDEEDEMSNKDKTGRKVTPLKLMTETRRIS